MEIVSSKSHKSHICSLRLRVHKALWPWSFKVAQSPHQANQPTGPGPGKPTYSLHIGSTYGIFTYMKGGFYGKCIGISYMDGLKTSETNTPTTQYWVFSALFREEQQKHIPPRQPALLKMVPCRKKKTTSSHPKKVTSNDLKPTEPISSESFPVPFRDSSNVAQYWRRPCLPVRLFLLGYLENLDGWNLLPIYIGSGWNCWRCYRNFIFPSATCMIHLPACGVNWW